MPLSEYEQRVLEELERDLGTDPKLGRAMSRPPRSRARLTWSVVGVIAGLGIMLGGMVAQAPLVGVAGFAVMIFAALWVLLVPRGTAGSAKASGESPKPDAKGRKPEHQSFMRRVEERFERRREQGDL